MNTWVISANNRHVLANASSKKELLETLTPNSNLTMTDLATFIKEHGSSNLELDISIFLQR